MTLRITGTFESVTEMIEHLQSPDHAVLVEMVNPNVNKSWWRLMRPCKPAPMHRFDFDEWSDQ